jgi:valyl-tRNA synthetase
VSSAAEASAAAPPGGSVSVVVSEGLQLLLPLAGLFDVEKELKRLDKQKQKVGASGFVCVCWDTR